MSKKTDQFAEETKIVHGIKSCYTTSMDLVPPIHMTSTYKFKDLDHGSGIFEGTDEGYLYTRISNPTTDLLQEKMALLEKGEDAIATSSGMSAISSVVMSLAKAGNNFVACNAVYGGTFALFNTHLKKFQISPKFISPQLGNDINKVEDLIDSKTCFLYIETPANPTLDIIDIAAWASIAKKHDIPLIVDNTFGSPYLQKPLIFGADIVIHSATKYLGGHGDIIGGIIVGSKKMITKIRDNYFNHFGPAMSPFNAWLILRGIKTLAIRMNRHSETGLKVAQWLEKHPKIDKIYYPGLQSHPAYALASKQMTKFSGIMSFEVKGGMEAGKIILNSVNLCILAISLGDCETLIQHPASMTHSTYSTEELHEAGISEGLIRLSIGLEDSDDIINDLEQSLSKV